MAGLHCCGLFQRDGHFLLTLLILVLLAGCTPEQFGIRPNPPGQTVGTPTPSLSPVATAVARGNGGPSIAQITTSSNVFAISDCIPASITVTATITSSVEVAGAVLWYRVSAQQPFTPVEAVPAGDDQYVATVKGTEIAQPEYGVWEFYLTAEDSQGHKSQSSVDTSVQLLPCVG